MNAEKDDDFKYKQLSELVIKAFYNVYNTLGFGFLERVYQNALMIELSKLNIDARVQYPIQVLYKGALVGEYFADIFVQERIIIEIKAAKNLSIEHEAQLLNYLKASTIEVGLLFNFGPKPQFKRIVFDNSRK